MQSEPDIPSEPLGSDLVATVRFRRTDVHDRLAGVAAREDRRAGRLVG
jgi:hypothetical protein